MNPFLRLWSCWRRWYRCSSNFCWLRTGGGVAEEGRVCGPPIAVWHLGLWTLQGFLRMGECWLRFHWIFALNAKASSSLQQRSNHCYKYFHKKYTEVWQPIYSDTVTVSLCLICCAVTTCTLYKLRVLCYVIFISERCRHAVCHAFLFIIFKIASLRVFGRRP